MEKSSFAPCKEDSPKGRDLASRRLPTIYNWTQFCSDPLPGKGGQEWTLLAPLLPVLDPTRFQPFLHKYSASKYVQLQVSHAVSATSAFSRDYAIWCSRWLDGECRWLASRLTHPRTDQLEDRGCNGTRWNEGCGYYWFVVGVVATVDTLEHWHRRWWKCLTNRDIRWPLNI